MTEDQNKFKTNYNTPGRPLASTFQPPPRARQKENEPTETTPAIPSGKGGQTPWNSTRSARDWLGDAPAQQEKTAARRERERERKPRPGLPKISMPNFSMPNFSMPKISLPKFSRSKFSLPKVSSPKASTAKRPQSPKAVKRGSKQPKVVTATISGLICAAIVLLAECGLWGFYCYSHTLPGDTNVKASTFMYCLAVFAGNFWAGAVVRRRSLKPSLIICGVFLLLSLIVSLNLFSWREIKIKMFLLKIVLTLIAAACGFILSLVPYLINKAIKKERQEQQQRRQRQLERRQLQQQQRELEQELAKRTRGRF